MVLTRPVAAALMLMARMMRPEDIADLVTVAEPRVRPDGRWVAFTVTTIDIEANRYASRVWVTGVDEGIPPRPFTAGQDRDSMPRWSPRGDELAFVSHRDHDGQGCELYVAPFGVGGELRRVASWPEDIEELAWSPDGTQLAFLARLRDEDRYGKAKAGDQPPRRLNRLFFRLDSVGWTADRVRQLFVVAADGSAKPRAVTSGPFQVEGLAWSPDGARLAFSSGRHDTWDLDLAVDLFVVEVPIAGAEPAAPRRLTETGDMYGFPSWSPDGTRLAFISFGDPHSEPRHGQIGSVDLESGQTELLTGDLDRNCAPYPMAREPVWDGDDVIFAVEDQGNTHLYHSGRLRRLLGGDREVSAFDVAAGTLAFCASTPTATSELFVADAGTAIGHLQERQVTRLGRPFGQAHDLVDPVPFVATAADGNQVQAWLMAPPDAQPGQRFPALLNIHGGPFSQYGNRFFDEFQLQVAAGFVVVYSNPRGSSGYSETSGRAIRWPEAAEDPGSGWGGVDHEDLLAVIDTAIERFDIIDPARLGVLGGSYGGYMTSWMVGHSDRFKAACSERAANNLLTMEQTSDIATAFRGYIGVSHLDNPGAYLRQSPISYVASMRTPMLLIHSEDDLRCPVSQAEELFVALRLLGRDPEMVRFPGESHELSRSGSPKHRVMRAEIILDWFRRHLMTAEPPP